MEMMGDEGWLNYMRAEFGDAFTRGQWLEIRYYIQANCPLSTMRMRVPGFGDEAVTPIPEAPPVIIPPTVADVTPIDSTAKQQLGFAAALESIEAGASVERLGVSVTLSKADVDAVDWVVI